MTPLDALAVIVILSVFTGGMVSTWLRARPRTDPMAGTYGDVPCVPTEGSDPEHVARINP